ncbi:MAG TPA: hypothetical protein VHA09_09290 [Nitrososphaera sp.]|nr:hypothetical protein [Nitrososphaera sp.]
MPLSPRKQAEGKEKERNQPREEAVQDITAKRELGGECCEIDIYSPPLQAEYVYSYVNNNNNNSQRLGKADSEMKALNRSQLEKPILLS